ncbi:MAG: NADH-quinone oxidoreductase subunit H [Rikenellaceae bacterium]
MEFLSLILLIVVSLVLPGVICRVRARLSGRKGASFFQHLYNLRVMLSKSVVYSYSSSYITRIVPVVSLALSFGVLLFVPFGDFKAVLGFDGDIVLFAYLLALSRFLMIIAAMDSGSSFQGMGSAREAFYGALLEPAIFIIGGTLALISGNISFSTVFSSMGSLSVEFVLVMVLVAYLFIKILTVETGRIPFDDTLTHLELTMVHEVMILDYSGVDLGFITLSMWLKMGALSVLAANSVSACCAGGWIATLIFSVLTGVYIGFVESFVAKNKMSRNSTFIMIISSIALVLFVVAYIVLQNIFV